MIAYEVFWIVAIVVFSLVEAATAGLVSIWFAGGSLCALICAWIGLNVWIQIGVFIVVSAILILCLRKIASKNSKVNKSDTNLDRIIGQSVIVTQKVDNANNSGAVRINDIEWRVKSKNGDVIEEGEMCKIEKIDGVKLVVSK